MERWSGRVALVTGASSGLGSAIAERLVRCGMIVIGCGRNVTKIQAASEQLRSCSGTLHGVQCDLRSEEQILSMFRDINAKHGGLDVCINNARLAKMCSLVSGTTDDWREMMDVNILGLSICTREAIKSMRAKGINDGHIINVNSILGLKYVATDTFHWYGAIKFMVTSLTEMLRRELRTMGSKIKASQITPGLTKTDFASRLIGDRSWVLHEERETLTVDQTVSAVIYILGAEPNMEVHDIIVRPTTMEV